MTETQTELFNPEKRVTKPVTPTNQQPTPLPLDEKHFAALEIANFLNSICQKVETKS